MKERIYAFERTHNPTCDLCEREVFEGEGICAACKEILPFHRGAVCSLCGRTVGEEGICLECKQKPLSVQKARSLFDYEGEAAALVLRYKKGARYLAFTLAKLLAPLAQEEFAHSQLLVGVPMTERAQKKRGYNQAQLLAREVALLLGKDCAEPVKKVKESRAQKSLSRREREKNLADSFRVADRAAVRGKDILLVDDALTTGSTVSAIAQRLYRAGARRVDCVTVCSVPQKMFSELLKGDGSVVNKE